MMKQLAENQDTLRQTTSEAIDDLTEKNEKVIDQQKTILQVSSAHRAVVENNLHELMREKGLIRSGQLEVANMIEHLKAKLDESLTNLKQQSTQMKENQATLLDDLNNLQSNALHISDKLGETTEYIFSQNEIASSQFDQTIQRLSEISQTIEKLQTLIKVLENSVDGKLAWITQKIGGTDEALANINLVLQHMGYLLFGMLLLVFVNAPAFYRISFVIAVPTNFICSLLQWRHVTLLELTQILGIIFATNLIRHVSQSIDFKNPFALIKKSTSAEKAKSTPNGKESKTSRGGYDETDGCDENYGNRNNNNDYSYSYVGAFKNRYREGSMTPSNASNVSVDARGLTPFTNRLEDRAQCVALTVKGDRCRNAAVVDRIYCRRHEK